MKQTYLRVRTRVCFAVILSMFILL